MFGMGPMELMIVGIIAVLLFGSRLPEVGRSLGKSIIEFKKGMRDIQDEMRTATNAVDTPARVEHRPSQASADDRDEPTAPKFDVPKFEPPTAEPQSASTPTAPTANV